MKRRNTLSKRIAILLLGLCMAAGVAGSFTTTTLAQPQDDKMQSQASGDKTSSDKMATSDKSAKKKKKSAKKDKMSSSDKMSDQNKPN
jgi:hypothetical protein